MSLLSQRVRDILEGRLCPYCFSKVQIKTSSSNDTKKHSQVPYYIACTKCDAYTYGVPGLELKAKGRLANSSLWIERQLAEKQVYHLISSHNITIDEIWTSLSGELGVFEPYLDIYYLGLEKLRQFTTLVARKKLSMDYKETKRYVQHSARKSNKGKLLRCIILHRFNEKETLVEFDDGTREKVTYIR